MKLETTARTAATMNKATTTTYVEAAQQGKNDWWRYLLGLVVGLIVGELFRRSGLVRTGVVVHAVVNLPTLPLPVLTVAG